MPDEIAPALTPEQWTEKMYLSPPPAKGEFEGLQLWIDDTLPDDDLCIDPVVVHPDGSIEARDDTVRFPSPEECHALAALALHGQPFGFTHDELTVLRWLSTRDCESDCYAPDGRRLNDYALLRSVIAKVAALLPPR